MRHGYIKSLDVLTKWAEKQGFEVIFDKFDVSSVDWIGDSLNEPNKIKIQAQYSNEFKVYLLLHELGHHVLRKDWSKFKKILPIAAYAEEREAIKKDLKHKRRTTYTVSIIEEEIEAWKSGYKLANKFGIHVNIEKWNKFKTKHLMIYIRYYGTH